MIKCVDIVRDFGPLAVRGGIIYAGVDANGSPSPFATRVVAEFWRENEAMPRPFISEYIVVRMDFAGRQIEKKISVCIPTDQIQKVTPLFSALTTIDTSGLLADVPYQMVISIWHRDNLLKEARCNVIFDSKSKIAFGMHIMPEVHSPR
jgi:hypothetical protein